MKDFAEPVLALETRLMLESDRLIAPSTAIVNEVEHKYSIHLDPEKLTVVPFGLEDWAKSQTPSTIKKPAGAIFACFIGRLELRKGIDVLLEIVPGLIHKYPNLFVHIVGDDRIPTGDGRPFRSVFEAAHPDLVGHEQIVFHGEVEDARLREFYRVADIVVAPSRFESFGLVHLEGMMFGKPVIGTTAGGMKEVVDDGVTGLLAVPGDAESLRACLERLVENEPLRLDMGRNARAAYLDKFEAKRMAEGVLAVFDRLVTAT